MNKVEIFLKKNPIYPAIAIEGHFSAKKRKIIIQVTKFVIISLPIIVIMTIIFGNYGINPSEKFIEPLIQKLLGVGLLSIIVYILMHLFEAYFISTYYFEYVAKNNYIKNENYTFTVGRILKKCLGENLLTGLLRSEGVGYRIFARLGISKEEMENLLTSQKEIKNPKIFDINRTEILKMSELINFIYQNYPDFKRLLTNHGIDENKLQETVSWVIYQLESEEYEREWWQPEKLAKIAGVAADWSFGRTYLLSKYGRDLSQDKEVNSTAISFEGRSRELSQIQNILERSSGANAILVGQPGQEKMEVIWNLVRQIKNKTTTPKLIGKKTILFLTNSFTTEIKDKHDFEDKLHGILTEALKAGNVILIIDNLPKLLLQANQFELNFTEIFEPYLSGIGGQIIALADTEYFHTTVEKDKALMNYFEVVMTKPLSSEEIVKIIAHEALGAEKIYEILFTYPAILEIAKSADYYFPDGVSTDKAKDLLNELSPWAVEKGFEIVGKNEVLTYVSEKTNIPVAGITLEEKEKLLDLENQLMKKVIAQREAVFSIASAIRRSRAGIRNENRPIGSFLFLGPTGVGKTETAKALSDVFFGSEKNMMRLDMSEYQNEEALSRLIGSVENNTQGILSNLLRDQPYGVLLLDEFEKTHKNVLNLFLQLLDEGYFTDAFGKKVNARNIIFIATSNAGADKIFEIIADGKNLKDNEDEIIAEIVKNGIFKPELINRFDGAILFHPLTRENLADISKLMLKKVAKRLADKGINLTIDKELVDFLAKNGYNPTFGARPMNRLIQNTIEEHLSDLIIRDEIKSGNTISFKVIGEAGNKDSLKPVVS